MNTQYKWHDSCFQATLCSFVPRQSALHELHHWCFGATFYALATLKILVKRSSWITLLVYLPIFVLLHQGKQVSILWNCRHSSKLSFAWLNFRNIAQNCRPHMTFSNSVKSYDGLYRKLMVWRRAQSWKTIQRLRFTAGMPGIYPVIAGRIRQDCNSSKKKNQSRHQNHKSWHLQISRTKCFEHLSI